MDTRLEAPRKQFLFWKKLWEETDGNEHRWIQDMWKFGKELGFSRRQTESIANYFRGKGLLQNDQRTIALTHAGVVWGESLLSQEEETPQEDKSSPRPKKRAARGNLRQNPANS